MGAVAGAARQSGLLGGAIGVPGGYVPPHTHGSPYAHSAAYPPIETGGGQFYGLNSGQTVDAPYYAQPHYPQPYPYPRPQPYPYPYPYPPPMVQPTVVVPREQQSHDRGSRRIIIEESHDRGQSSRKGIPIVVGTPVVG